MFSRESEPAEAKNKSRLYRIGAFIGGSIGLVYSTYGLLITERGNPNNSIATACLGLSVLSVAIPVDLMLQDRNEREAEQHITTQVDQFISETEAYLKGIGEADRWIREIYLHLEEQPRLSDHGK